MHILNDTEQQALRDALDDEYRAWATYDQVIHDFGPERPFINIREAEARHIDALRALFQRYDLEVPENPWPGRVPRFTSTREACEAGIEAEVENGALFDRLTGSTSREDILAVFRNLKRASQERHLPAFRRCATRGVGPGAVGAVLAHVLPCAAVPCHAGDVVAQAHVARDSRNGLPGVAPPVDLAHNVHGEPSEAGALAR